MLLINILLAILDMGACLLNYSGQVVQLTFTKTNFGFQGFEALMMGIDLLLDEGA
jgi:hypothetical protein